MDEDKRKTVVAMFESCPAELGELTIVCSKVHQLLEGNLPDLEEAVELMQPKLAEASRARIRADGFGEARPPKGCGGILEHVFQPGLALLTGKLITAQQMALVSSLIEEAAYGGP
jgi:hypothetical protein